MKKISTFLILIFILGSVFSAIPEVTQINYDPNPAVPGSTITVLAQIENLDNLKKTDVYVSIVETYPFTVKQTNQRNIGNMGELAKTITMFEIYVDPSAENKQYDLEIKVSEGLNTTAKIKKMPILVSGNAPTLEVINISQTKLIPGQEEEILIQIANIGTSTAYDIAVELKEDRIVTQTGLTIEREITPLGSAIGYIDKLFATQKATVGIIVSVNRKAELKNYTLPVTISYRTPSGERVSETSYIGFKVSGPVIMDATIKENANLIAGERKEITIELFNKGSGRAEFMIVNVETSFANIEREKLFIGSLEPNDIDSFKLNLTINDDAVTENGLIRLIVDYQDSDAINKQQIIELPVKIYSKADGAALTPFNLMGLIINIVILLIIGVIIYKGYQKFKK